MNSMEIRHNFAYHAPKDEEIKDAHEYIRQHCGELALTMNNIIKPCRELSMAITKLEEAMFWANAAIARNGLNSE